MSCPAGFTSVAGSSSCYACGFGQTSAPGGLCIDLCKDGEAWSQLFQQCAICPTNTFSHSGDTACTRCPPGKYAPERSAGCFSDNSVGGIMRVTGVLANFRLDDWAREVANLVYAEISEINTVEVSTGSVVIYFSIKDPDTTTFTDETPEIQRLGGNEKMLLLYQWWVTDSTRLDDFDYDIIDFKVYARRAGSVSGQEEVVTLFAPAGDAPDIIIPQRPDDENKFSLIPAINVQEGSTLQISVTVGDDSAFSLQPTISFSALLLTIALQFLFHFLF